MIDTQRDGYDNLFLVGGYDWHAKMTHAGTQVEQEAKRLATNFDKLDKKDILVLAKWENEVLLACGLKGKPLPKIEAKVEIDTKTKVEVPATKPAVKRTTSAKTDDDKSAS